MWTKVIKNDVKGSVGMPLTVQVVSYAWDDELAVGVMKSLEEEVKFNKYPEI
jgi:Asp-tRNA(Asn)/Glu-tRNA(Gln) amidotransferase A subunit family amidase